MKTLATDEHDDDLEPEVNEGAEIETMNYAADEDPEEEGPPGKDVTPADIEEEGPEGQGSDTI